VGQNKYPLDGVRVVEISQIWAAPQLASSLGDMGAQVIRVESLMSTDVARTGGADKQEYRILLDYQRHARSREAYVTLNIRDPQGMSFFRELLRTADVFICNLSPRVLKKLALTYEDVRELRPDIVMITISAAGQDGPWSDLVAFGPAMNAVVGSDLLVGYPDDTVFMSSYWDADPAMGVAASYAVLLALYHREETGEGQHMDMSFAEFLTSLLGEPILESQMAGRNPTPQGNRHPWQAPHGIYPTSEEDRWVGITVTNEEEWVALCTAMGQPELATDPRFADMPKRIEHRSELNKLVAAWTRGCTNYGATDLLQGLGVAACPAFTIAELYHDQHHRYRRTSIKLDETGFDRDLITYGLSWRLSRTPGAFRRLGQGLGADNQAFYGGIFGLTSEEVVQLEESQVFY